MSEFDPKINAEKSQCTYPTQPVKLFEAAWTGNVEYLLKLLEEDPCILHTVALTGGETPLHIACLAGHLEFTREVLKLRKEFAKELNQDGFTPLHIASANGHVEIVKELLKIDGINLCQIEGGEGRIPLHCAVIKGRVDVIKELISSNVGLIASSRTARGETALHLAVKYNQFEVFKVLVNSLKQSNKEDLLNERDGQGNTILHLAVSRKQYQVIDFVINNNGGSIDVNSLNTKALTPLDVLLLFQSEAGDREIEDILKQAGAMKADDLHSLPIVVVHEDHLIKSTSNQTNEHSTPPTTDQSQSAAVQLLEYFEYDYVKHSSSEVRNILLVVVILIATATYQAALSPPGGVWQDDVASNSNSTTTPHTAGQAVMGTKSTWTYSLFLLFNSLGFFTALTMINILTVGFPLRFELQLSMFALTVTYDICMAAIAPDKLLNHLFAAFSIVIPFVVPIGTVVLRHVLKKRRVLGFRSV